MFMQTAVPQGFSLKITGKHFAFAAAPDSIVGILTANSQPGQFVELFVLAMANK